MSDTIRISKELRTLIEAAQRWWIISEKESIKTIEKEFEDGPEKERMLRQCKIDLQKKKIMSDKEIIEKTMQFAIWAFEGMYEKEI